MAPTPEPAEEASRIVLFLSDGNSSFREGIAGVNRSLAKNLARYKGIKLYNLVFANSQTEETATEDGQISLALNGTSVKELYQRFNLDPTHYVDGLRERIPHVHQIVGHAPVTAQAALTLRDQLYPEAKVVLFFHIVPHSISWFSADIPYPIPSDMDLVHLGEEADQVYSVTDQLHWFNTAKFRNRARRTVDHRLFLPQCSESVFSISWHQPQQLSFLVMGDGGGVEPWLGLDIAACAVSKVAKALKQENISLTVGGIAKDRAEETRQQLSPFLEGVELQVHSYDSQEECYGDLAQCTICLVPSRAEPFGCAGLQALSAGVPTLISELCALSSVVKRLTLEPDSILVPVIPSEASVLQDASAWRDRILSQLQDMGRAHARAQQLQTALRRDEDTKESHDNFISLCLGGIRVRPQVTSVTFTLSRDEEKELPIVRSFNQFLTAALKQSWRLKHHPLTQMHDLPPLLPRLQLPIELLRDTVINKMEEHDRRIVGVDDGAFVVFCPTAAALSDLWAMCDRINAMLSQGLLQGGNVANAFRLKEVQTRVHIEGPEFLRYRAALLKAEAL